MSEHVTHTAILDDALRLMLALDDVPAAFKAAANTEWEIARLGAITRHGDRHTIGLLSRMREGWDVRKPGDKLEARLAFVLGWLCHRAADRQMKPIFRAFDTENREKPTECSIYHDVFLLREIYGKTSPPLSSAMLEPDGAVVDVARTEELVRTLVQRALVGLHTLKPDDDAPEHWVDGLIELRNRYSVDLKWYAAAFARPDPEKVRRYITEGMFYDADERIIVLARQIQRGGRASSAEVASALELPLRSHYAQVLGISLGYLRAAGDFFASRIGEDALFGRLDIGKPGRDGRPV